MTRELRDEGAINQNVRERERLIDRRFFARSQRLQRVAGVRSNVQPASLERTEQGG